MTRVENGTLGAHPSEAAIRRPHSAVRLLRGESCAYGTRFPLTSLERDRILPVSSPKSPKSPAGLGCPRDPSRGTCLSPWTELPTSAGPSRKQDVRLGRGLGRVEGLVVQMLRAPPGPECPRVAGRQSSWTGSRRAASSREARASGGRPRPAKKEVTCSSSSPKQPSEDETFADTLSAPPRPPEASRPGLWLPTTTEGTLASHAEDSAAAQQESQTPRGRAAGAGRRAGRGQGVPVAVRLRAAPRAAHAPAGRGASVPGLIPSPTRPPTRPAGRPPSPRTLHPRRRLRGCPTDHGSRCPLCHFK